MDHEQEGTKINVQDLFQAFQNQPEVRPLPNAQKTNKKNVKAKEKTSSVAQRLQLQSSQNQQTKTLESQKKPRTVSQGDKSAPIQPPQQPKKSQKVKEHDAALEEALEDLDFRFFKNMPKQDRTNMVRVCFQLELAFWYYLDYYTDDEERGHLFKKMQFREFVIKFMNHCKDLNKYTENIDATIGEWLDYKKKVPTYGGILLDESLDNVLLVQGYSSKTWTFPKGKINQNENPRDCAIREVREETSFDFSTVSNKEKRIQKMMGDKMVCFFIVKNVPTTFQFTPMTKKEIRDIQWFNVWDLPGKGDPSNTGTHRFFLVHLFLQEIHSYIRKEKIKMEKPTQGISFSGTDLIQSLMGEKPTKSYVEKTPIKEEEILRPTMAQLPPLEVTPGYEGTFPIGYTPLKANPISPDAGYLSKTLEFNRGKVYYGGLPQGWPEASSTENTLAEMFRSATVQDEHNMPTPGGKFSLAPQAVNQEECLFEEALQPDAVEWYKQGTFPQYFNENSSMPVHIQPHALIAQLAGQPLAEIPKVRTKISQSDNSAFTPIAKQSPAAQSPAFNSLHGSRVSLAPIGSRSGAMSKASSIASSSKTIMTKCSSDLPPTVYTPRDVLRLGCRSWNQQFKLDYNQILEPFKR